MLKRWNITHAQARHDYRYDPDTGIVLGLYGNPIGHVKRKNGPDSRCKVVVEREEEGCIPIARLIWFWVYGEWPETIIDHINGDPFDHRLVNLRPAEVQENNYNSAQRVGVSGYRNVVRGKRGRGWRVEFGSKAGGVRQRIFVSRQFATPEEASELAERMRAELHGEYGSTRAL